MSIKLIRNSGLSGSITDLKIYVNDEKIDTIANKESKVLDLKTYPAKLQVRSFGNKSNEITVQSGDVIEIQSSNANTAFMVALFILLILTPIIESITIIIIGFAILLILAFSMKAYKLEKIDSRVGE